MIPQRQTTSPSAREKKIHWRWNSSAGSKDMKAMYLRHDIIIFVKRRERERETKKNDRRNRRGREREREKEGKGEREDDSSLTFTLSFSRKKGITQGVSLSPSVSLPRFNSVGRRSL
jgi:hypothetical protein